MRPPALTRTNPRPMYSSWLNARLGNRVAIGVVPTFLRNPRVQDIEPDNAFVLGVQEQLYMSDQTSLLGEWVLSEGREDLAYDGVAFGLELEVGGHFFKILLTKSSSDEPDPVPRWHAVQVRGGRVEKSGSTSRGC